MAKRKLTKNQQLDTTYILKITMYLVLGSQWLYVVYDPSAQLPVPFGALVALMFARHEHFQIDRKIEYAIILLSMFVAFWLPMGITLSLK